MRAICVSAALLVVFGCQRIDSNKATPITSQPDEGPASANAKSSDDYADSDAINAPGAPNNIATPDANMPPSDAVAAQSPATGTERAAREPSLPQPDNTAVNKRDREGDTKTPLDQGGSEADRKTTAEIRQRIVSADNMSLSARNVKIITSDGRVTLRGPVSSEAERAAILKFAREVAGESNVDDQLEVAAETRPATDNP